MSTTAIRPPDATHPIHASPGWFIFLGIVFIVGGIVAIATPFIAGLVVTTFIGAALIIVGVMQIIQAWSIRPWGGFLWQLIMGLVILAGGIATWWSPIPAALWLTLLIAAAFIVKGIFQLMLGFQVRPHDGWGWIVFAGIISIVVGVLIFLDWPLSAFYAIGVLAGISFVFTGLSYLMIASAGRRLAS